MVVKKDVLLRRASIFKKAIGLYVSYALKSCNLKPNFKLSLAKSDRIVRQVHISLASETSKI